MTKTKKISFLILAAFLVVVLMAPAAMAALTEQQQQTIADIHKKIDEYRNQIIEIQLDAGVITEEQAAFAKERNEIRNQNRSQYEYYGAGQGGFGMGCGGKGMGQGMGRGNHYMNYYPGF